MYQKTLQSTLIWDNGTIFHLSETINKELTRKVHRSLQEAPTKMPSCIADKAQSTQNRYYKYVSAVVFHWIPPSPAKIPQTSSYSIFRHSCNLIHAHKGTNLLSSTFAWFHCSAKEPGLPFLLLPPQIFFTCTWLNYASNGKKRSF